MALEDAVIASSSTANLSYSTFISLSFRSFRRPTRVTCKPDRWLGLFLTSTVALRAFPGI